MELILSSNNGDLLLKIKLSNEIKPKRYKSNIKSNFTLNYTITATYNIQKLIELYYKNPLSFMYYQIKYLIENYTTYLTLDNIEELNSNKEYIRQTIIEWLKTNKYLVIKDM